MKQLMMGFEPGPQVQADYNNNPIVATVGGKYCEFRSEFEYRWAMYLQYRKESGEILDWEYEVYSYNFAEMGYKTPPWNYLTDFLVTPSIDRKVCQECKGKLSNKDIIKFKRVQEKYPDDRIELVLYRIPQSGSKSAAIRANAARFVDKIINAEEVFRATRNEVNYELPWY